MTQNLRAFTALAEDSVSVPKIHGGWLTTAYNYRDRGPGTLWLLQVHAHEGCVYKQVETHIHS